jgi:LuxR family maltose regulon positive regulatory protein
MPTAPATWLAATKLSAPARRHDALVRPRLTEEFGHFLTYARVILISAPAGAGKTTLLADLARRFPETTWAWLLLDAEDNDPSRLAAALAAALEGARIKVADGAGGDPKQLVTSIINRIAGLSEHRVAIVLDDLHTITEKSVHELLDYLADHAPPNLRLVLATRHDPPMALARRRARGELGEIRLAELNFTEEETSALANECLALNLTEKEVRQIHTRTEGWAAGLRLLATTLAQLPSRRATLLESGMQGSRRIFDFLAEEVLDRQAPELRGFLLETSVLVSLSPKVCDALTGRRDSIRILEDLYRRNLYVVAADESETTFRYHDLFADFLRERLRRERPEAWAELHKRAAQAEVSPDRRLRHWIEAEHWDEAAAEIESVGPEYARRGFVITLRRWIFALPEEVRLRHPRVLYLLGHAIWTQSEFFAAQPWIEQALEGFRRNGDNAGQGEAILALANAALMTNRLEECSQMIQEALSFDIPPASRAQIHTATAWAAIYRKDWTEAERQLDHLYGLLNAGVGTDNPLAVQLVLFSEGVFGYVARIDQLLRSMETRLTGQPDLTHSAYHLLNSAILIHRGDLDEGEREAERALAIALECGQIVLVTAALCTNFAIVMAGRSDWAEMDRWASDGLDETKYGHITRNWRLHFQYLQARARWGAGDIEGLRATMEAASLPNPVAAPASKPYFHLIRGMLRMAERSYGQAEQAFREALREEEDYQVTRAISSARTLLAYALLRRGDIAQAMEVFGPVLDFTERQDLAGYVMRENPYVIPLLRHAYERNIHREFAAKVLGRMNAPVNAVEASGGEALSDRELEVLRVLAEGLGNRDIAGRLFVSEATVKTHVQRILRKLDADSRTQAVSRARDLMLL